MPPPAWRRALSPAVIATYFVLGLIAYWPVLPGISHRFFGRTNDYILSAWFIGWVPHAIAHGLNPFFTNSMFVPTGVNLAQNTASPLLGLIGAPLTEAFSPLVSTNVLMLLAMPVSATAAFVVLRKWKVWLPGAALGGLVYGFSAYMVGQGTDHVVFTFVPIPPFIALTLASILQRKGSPWRLGIQLGLLIVAQYLISQEVLVDTAIVSFAALVCVALRYPGRIPEIARAMGRPLLVAFPLVAALLAYPIWMLVAGPQHAPMAVNLRTPFHNDLLSFFVPGPLQHASFGMRSLGYRLMQGPNPVTLRLSGSNPVEFDGFIGVAVLALSGFLVWRSRRSPRMQLATVLFLGTAVLSLGPYLVIDARATGVWLPFLLLAHIPLVEEIVPVRFSLEVFGCLAAMIAFGLDDMQRDRPRPKWLTSRVLAGAFIVALVVTQLPQWPYSSPQESTLPTALRTAVPAGDPVTITYPYPTNFTAVTAQPLGWQMDSRYTFRLLGGYAHIRHPNGGSYTIPTVMNPPGLQQFLAGQNAGLSGEPFGPALPVSPELVAATRTALSRYDVRLVIVDRSVGGSGQVMELFNDAVGPPKLSAGQFSMWADWHGRPSHEEFLPHIVTSVLRPANGATLSGTAVLDAGATAWVRVTKVEFLLTDETHHSDLIAEGHLIPYGWVAKWNTTSVANGTYSLQSIAYDASGASRLSTSILITVKNH